MKTIKLFWEWFQGNETTLRTLHDQKSEIQKIFIYWLDRHLHNYCEALDFIIIYPKKSGEFNRLLVSANGDPKYFDKVTALVHNAPFLLHWKIIEFTKSSENIAAIDAEIDRPYLFQDIVLKASELKFIPFTFDSANKIDLIVYFKNYVVYCKNKNFWQAVPTVMQNVSGDHSLSQIIDFVELAQVPEDDKNQFIYLYELQAYIEKWNLSKTSAYE